MMDYRLNISVEAASGLNRREPQHNVSQNGKGMVRFCLVSEHGHRVPGISIVMT